jgi:hypothetical protein
MKLLIMQFPPISRPHALIYSGYLYTRYGHNLQVRDQRKRLYKSEVITVSREASAHHSCWFLRILQRFVPLYARD